ncbi:hypothetical protein D9M69_506020 [compost metagenome]
MYIEATMAPTAVPMVTTPVSAEAWVVLYSSATAAQASTMYLRLPPAPQNSVVVASEIWPSRSRHRRALQCQKSGSRPARLRTMLCSGLERSGRISTPVCGMRVLNQAAST